MNINFELYKVFYEVANQKSISKGAEKLMISQPAVSQSIQTLENEFLAKTIIIATGARNKKLNIKGEEENIGRGLSYCAVCDGAFYKDKIVAVVGGGNSALEEAIYLTQFVKKAYLIHRRDIFRADDIVQKRAQKNNKIEFVLNSVVEEILADEKVYAIKIKNNLTNKTQELKIDGIFPYIGQEPNAELFSGQIEQDKYGFIITGNSIENNGLTEVFIKFM